MAKKIFLTTIATLLFILALATTGFAESNMTTKLGNEVTSSMNKTEKSMDDLARKTDLDEAGETIKNGVTDTKDAVRDGIDDLVDEDDSRTENRAIAGRTGNYATGEVQTTTQARNGMTRNAWIWIVMVVVALIIVAAVWYFATQQNRQQQ